MSTDEASRGGGTMWSGHVSRWHLLGPPLCPSSEDICQYERVAGNWTQRHGPPRILLWGVTPEIVSMRLPAGADFMACDKSLLMIGKFRPVLAQAGVKAICGNWLNLPLRAGSRDIVIGDGCFSFVRYPDQYRELALSLRRLLSRAGVCAFRFFIRPAQAESIDQAVADLRAGRISSFHLFKRRAGVALQESAERGISVRAIWEWWKESGIAPEELTERFGWNPETIATMDSYRDGREVFTFPTLDELRSALSDLLIETDCRFPGYEFGEGSPIIELRPKEGAWA